MAVLCPPGCTPVSRCPPVDRARTIMQSAGFHAKGLVRSREKHLSCLDYSQSTGLLWRLVKPPPCYTCPDSDSATVRQSAHGGMVGVRSAIPAATSPRSELRTFDTGLRAETGRQRSRLRANTRGSMGLGRKRQRFARWLDLGLSCLIGRSCSTPTSTAVTHSVFSGRKY